MSVTDHVDGLVQDCSNSSALAMELLQSCAKPSMSALLIQVYLKAIKLAAKSYDCCNLQ